MSSVSSLTALNGPEIQGRSCSEHTMKSPSSTTDRSLARRFPEVTTSAVGCDLRLSDSETGCGRKDLSDRFKEVRVMTMRNMPPVWHTGWIPPTALTAVFLALIIAAVVGAARYLRGHHPRGGPTQGLDHPAPRGGA